MSLDPVRHGKYCGIELDSTLEILPSLFSLPDCVETVAQGTVEQGIARHEADALAQLRYGFGVLTAEREHHAQISNARGHRRVQSRRFLEHLDRVIEPS